MEQQQAHTATHRLPPQNIEAEQCVLGSILLQSGALGKVLEDGPPPLAGPVVYYVQAVRAGSIIASSSAEGHDWPALTVIKHDGPWRCAEGVLDKA